MKTDVNKKFEQMKCKPCEGGVPPLTKEEALENLNAVANWKLDDIKIKKEFRFVNFKQTMEFVNRIADLAENEGHHPDLYVSYGFCEVILWTHAINGLSENDFIMAAKIDRL